ncbi:MAG: tetratricopeptide repeat protein, partial [Verrucomicrobia bacterium]|nr:tetratricopeptide repeat protein [Verrucomicrobiota bacterium]
ALAIDEQSFGPEHPNVAGALNNLAALLQDTNRLAEAEPLYRRALAIDEQSFGPEHPNVAGALNNLAALLQDTNRLAEAELLMRRALAIDEQSFGPDHPNVAIRLNNLANLLQDTNRLTEAEPLYRRALAIRESGLVPDHPDTFSSIQRLADVLEKLGKREECERLREQFADRVLHTATTVAPLTRRQLALHFYRRADHQRAEQLLRQLLEEGFEVPGTCCHLARIALMTDQIEDGRKHIARAWQERSQAAPYVVPRILWLQLALEMLEHGDPAPLIGRLKTALQNDGAFQEWTMEPVLEHLKGRMQQTEADRQNWELLRALVAALSDRVELPELGNFPAWREAQPEPLD